MYAVKTAVRGLGGLAAGCPAATFRPCASTGKRRCMLPSTRCNSTSTSTVLSPSPFPFPSLSLQRRRSQITPSGSNSRCCSVSRSMSTTTPGNGSTARPTTSVDPEEVALFSKVAKEWWDPNGGFKALHVLNRTRLAFIRSAIEQQLGLPAYMPAPFANVNILDVGCGGGLLSEPLARLGGTVVGVDATKGNVSTARVHAARDPAFADGRLVYTHDTVEGLVEGGKTFDVVIASEVVEHVVDMETFVVDCASAVKPGGLLILSTLNRTLLSYALGIVAAEQVLGWAPPGTHTHEKFVKPEELRAAACSDGGGMDHVVTQGMVFSIKKQAWELSTDQSINYISAFTKPATPTI